FLHGWHAQLDRVIADARRSLADVLEVDLLAGALGVCCVVLVPHEALEDERASGLQVLRDASQAALLLLARAEHVEGVVDDVDDPEAAAPLDVRERTDRDGDPRAAGFRLQTLDHGWRDVDALDVHASLHERQRDAPGADAELEHATSAGECGE